jgi:hypothetical protein
LTLDNQREKRVSRHAWKHRLHALGVKELPFCMAGQYKGHSDGCTVIHEAVVSQDLWIDILSLAWSNIIMISMCSNDLCIF